MPPNVESLIDAFEHGLSEQEYRDPAYRYQVAFVPIVKNRATSSDVAIQFFKADSQEAKEISDVLLKEVDKNRYTAGDVVKIMNETGYPNFKMHHHIQLWKSLDTRNPDKGFGREDDYKNTWVWFDNWVERVRAHCEEQGEPLQSRPMTISEFLKMVGTFNFPDVTLPTASKHSVRLDIRWVTEKNWSGR